MENSVGKRDSMRRLKRTVTIDSMIHIKIEYSVKQCMNFNKLSEWDAVKKVSKNSGLDPLFVQYLYHYPVIEGAVYELEEIVYI